MTERGSEQRIELRVPEGDLILPFQAEHADVLSRLVKLGPTVDIILSRHDYPEPVSQLLGEAVALTALLGASLKYEGKFILQASTDGPVDLLVADYQVPGGLRGYARFSAERLAELLPDGRLLGDGHLAMTIDRGSDTERYQGVVSLEGESLTQAADTYFRQSEQLPTFIKLAVARHYRAGKSVGRPWTWRAGGLLVQKLTREGGAGGQAEARRPSRKKTGREQRRSPRRSRTMSCSTRLCRPSACCTAYSTKSGCAPIEPSRLRAIAAARARASRSC